MAFTKTSNLKVDPNVILADWEHAARVFGDQGFRLAPKFDFSFHCSFKINVAALKNANIVQRYGQEINMLVKSIDLPTFTLQTDTLNQYNRKKNVQYQHQFGEVTVKFHDDNMGLINQLWQNYYSYYYADPTSGNNAGAYTRNAMQNYDHIPTSYGLDNKSTNPFFTYIKVYQMARHEYVCYTLINPIITSFIHGKLDYAQNKTREFEMKFKFEAVTYSVGSVDPNLDPAGGVEGFGITHYDTALSPLQGINPDPSVIDPSFVQALDTEKLGPGILNNAISQVNANQNAQQPNAPATSGGGGLNIGAIAGGIALGAAAIGIGSKLLDSFGGLSGIGNKIGNFVSGIGLPDVAFPGSGSDTDATVASDNPTDEASAQEQQDAQNSGDPPPNTDDTGDSTDPNTDPAGTESGDGSTGDGSVDDGGEGDAGESTDTSGGDINYDEADF